MPPFLVHLLVLLLVAIVAAIIVWGIDHLPLVPSEIKGLFRIIIICAVAIYVVVGLFSLIFNVDLAPMYPWSR